MAPHGTSEAWQDVRGTGFTARISLDVARGRLAALLPAATAERVPLVEAIGRLSAEAVLATRDVPHLPSARIDGYPLAAAATFGASAYNPLPLDMGVRAITAGAPMPPGTDAVLPFMAAAATGDFIEAAEPVAPGDGVELAGAVWRRGDVVLPAGRRLSALDIACAASAGLREIPVRRRPHVGLSAAGPKGPNEPGDTWTTILASLVARDGGVLSAEMQDAADLQLLHGRTGCGMDDDAAPTLAALGQVMVHGIAIAPGGSAGIGYHESVAVVLLPGEPVACLTAYELLVGPAIRRLAGLPEALPHPRRPLRLTAKIASQVGTTELWLVRPQDNGVAPLAPPDRATLGIVVKACGFVLVGPESEGHNAGSEVEVYFLGSDYG